MCGRERGDSNLELFIFAGSDSKIHEGRVVMGPSKVNDVTALVVL